MWQAEGKGGKEQALSEVFSGRASPHVLSISPETQNVSFILPILQMGILSPRTLLETYFVCMELV